MIEEILLNYGVLGLWTVYLIYEKQTILRKITKVLEEIHIHLRKQNGGGH